MSRKRQATDPDEGLLVRTYALTHPGRGRGLDFRPRAVDWDQLAYASSGVMSIRTAEGTWVVPSHRAVWIPAGVTFEVELAGKVSIRTLFFARGLARGLPRRCQAVNVPPLLRELILAAIAQGLLRRQHPAQERLARVILDQLQMLPAVPLQLPLPRDQRARRAAQRLQATPGELSLREVSREAGASKRTLERLFRLETGMTLGRWRQRLRLIEALRLLAEGKPVTRVALDVGYRSASAFVSAFRRQLGTTPARYFRPERRG
jgi:AraC-like DNA-binding protein